MIGDKSSALNAAEKRIENPYSGTIRIGLPSVKAVRPLAPAPTALPEIKKPLILRPVLKKPDPVNQEVAVAPAVPETSPVLDIAIPDTEKAIEKMVEAVNEISAEIDNAPLTAEAESAAEPETVSAEESAEPETQAQAEPVKRRRRTSTKAADAAEEDTVSVSVIDLPKTTAEMAAVISTLFPRMIDPEWKQFEDDVRADLAEIQSLISPDANPGTVRYAASEINALAWKIHSSYYQVKTIYENQISRDKIPGDVERRIILGSVGSNEQERRRAGIFSAANIVADDGKSVINIFEVTNEFRLRYNFLQSVNEFLRRASDSLISINTSLKLDKDTFQN